MAVTHEFDTGDPPVWSSVKLDAKGENYGRVVCRDFPNTGYTTWPTNTVWRGGVNILTNGNARSSSIPAGGWIFEATYEDGQEQSEAYAEFLFNNLKRRPYFSRYFFNIDDMDNEIRGRTVFTQKDALNTLFTVNPRVGIRRVTLADDGEIAGVAAPVTIRGIELSGGGDIVNNTNTPVEVGGIKMSGTSTWHQMYPRYYDQDTRPTIDTNAVAFWRKTSTGAVKILFNDPTAGHVSALLSAEP
jgi:hypothetical protein